MEKLKHKEVELSNVKSEMMLLDEYSSTFDDDKMALGRKKLQIEEQMKEFQKMIDGTGPDSQRIQELMEDAFSAFR